MTFDTRLLGPREELVLDLRPHWSQLFRPAALLTIVLGAAIASVALDAPRIAQYVIAAGLLVALAQLLVAWLRRRRINFVLTSERVIYSTGLGAKRGLEIPLDRVGTIRFEQTLAERLMQQGDVAIEALGDGGVQVFRNVPRPKHVQREIYAAMEADQQAMPDEFVEPSPPQSQSTPYSIPQQIDQLDQLRRRGVITEIEFEHKKREMLDRM